MIIYYSGTIIQGPRSRPRPCCSPFFCRCSWLLLRNIVFLALFSSFFSLRFFSLRFFGLDLFDLSFDIRFEILEDGSCLFACIAVAEFLALLLEFLCMFFHLGSEVLTELFSSFLASECIKKIAYGADACRVLVGEFTDTVRRQILAVRDTGETNMFDVPMVQQIANRLGYYELVLFLIDHAKEYAHFIMTGQIM